MSWLGLLVQGDDRVGNKVHGDDVNPVVRPQRQRGETGQEDKCAHDVELRRFGSVAVAQDDAGAEDGAGHVGE